jgi:hypothetical protein
MLPARTAQPMLATVRFIKRQVVIKIPFWRPITVYGMGGKKGTSLTCTPCGEPLLSGSGPTPPLARVMFASTKIMSGLYLSSTVFTPLQLFNH